jgi:cytochrome b561
MNDESLDMQSKPEVAQGIKDPNGGDPKYQSPGEAGQLGIYFALAAIGAICAVVNFATPQLMQAISERDIAAIVVYSCFGWFPFQAMALTAWLVFGRERFGTRLTLHWLVALLLFGAWAAGVNIAAYDRRENYNEIFLVFASLGIASLAMQIPLWVLRLYFGWRVESIDAAKPQPELPLAIRDLMVGTFLVAVSLGFARLASSGRIQFWPVAWLMVVGGLSALAIFSLLPFGLFALRKIRPGRCFLFTSIYATVWYLGTIFVFNFFHFFQPYAVPDFWESIGLGLVLLNFAGVLIITQQLVRALGYRLKIGRSEATQTAG